MPDAQRLADVLTDPSRKAAVVQDCLGIIDAEVADKSGLSGMAIKAGYKVVKGFKPGFVQNVVTDLLPQFADAIEPVYQEAVEQDKAVGAYLADRSDRVADSLLAITDRKAARSKNKLVRKTYDRLRGQAKTHVQAAIPRLGAVIEKHT